MNKLFIGLLGAALVASGAPGAQAQQAPAKPKAAAKPTTSRAASVNKAVAAANAPAAPKETPPEGSAPRDFALPAKEDFTLDNGLKGRLVPYGQVPKVTMMVAIQAGNVHEGANEVAVADLLAKLLQEGTPTMTATQLAEKMARMGGSLYISAGADQTTLQASCLSEYAPQLATLLAEVVMNPALPASELSRLKTDLKRQMNLARAQPGTQARQKYSAAIYGSHPYGRPLPTDAQLDALTLEQVQNFYRSQYGAQRTSVYAAGLFDAPALRQAISSAWKDFTKGPAPLIEVAKPLTRGDILTQDRPSAPQSTIVVGLPAADPTSPDYIRLRVTNSLLGGSFGSRITRNIREDKGYTYSPYSYLETHYHTGNWSENADVTTADTYNSLREIMNEVERLQKTPPTEAELKGIQNYESGMFVLRNSSPGGIIGQLNNLDLQGLPDSFLTEQVQNINAVTPQQVSATARKYIRPEAMTVVVVGDKKQVDPQLKKFQAERKKPL
ncbi:M16 family metallopeptidase [Hymenobacter negativus]|uniref:Insulinase family protein n=1 Tax=Hymenobacter negativus TaxID=2795026 RepID=A0ABS0QCP3_9BACT|nr:MULTISPECIES: pitrilysin family protein [Bacteria]MBH8560464.1 insulinase family protein [Hymenobacter negativus]MBH8571411.1 insulinase family protein [Hymenobacter negativus]MBR7211151.1 insulinase family protein [Microvirga sp. STS02]